MIRRESDHIQELLISLLLNRVILCGYSIDLLPQFWQTVSAFNPILYMVNGFRYGILGVSDVSLANAYGIIALFVIGLAATCLWLLHRGIGLRS